MKLLKFALVLSFGFLAINTTAHAALEFNPEVPATVKNQMIDDLSFVESMQGGTTSGLYRSIFGKDNLHGSDLSQFFNQRVFTVDLSSCGGGSGVAACVHPPDSHVMYLTKNYINNSVPQVFRVSIVFHESRHTEDNNDNWDHIACPTPFLDDQGHDIVGIISGNKLEGRPACDDVALGAYGLQATLLKNIQNTCTNCSEKILQDAQIFGDDTILRISDPKVRKQMNDDLQAKHP